MRRLVMLLLLVPLAVEFSLGAWAAARLALKRGSEFVRAFVILIIVLSATALFAGVGL